MEAAAGNGEPTKKKKKQNGDADKSQADDTLETSQLDTSQNGKGDIKKKKKKKKHQAEDE